MLRQITAQLADLVMTMEATSMELVTKIPEVVTNIVADPRLITLQSAVSVHSFCTRVRDILYTN